MKKKNPDLEKYNEHIKKYNYLWEWISGTRGEIIRKVSYETAQILILEKSLIRKMKLHRRFRKIKRNPNKFNYNKCKKQLKLF